MGIAALPSRSSMPKRKDIVEATTRVFYNNSVQTQRHGIIFLFYQSKRWPNLAASVSLIG